MSPRGQHVLHLDFGGLFNPKADVDRVVIPFTICPIWLADEVCHPVSKSRLFLFCAELWTRQKVHGWYIRGTPIVIITNDM